MMLMGLGMGEFPVSLVGLLLSDLKCGHFMGVCRRLGIENFVAFFWT
jgi:hypothetical protein